MKASRNFKIGATAPDTGGNKMSFTVTFAAAPDAVTITKPVQKYNKAAFLSVEWDDGSPGSTACLPFLKSLSYTDGCGNAKPYTAAIAINGGTGQPGDPGYNQNYWQAPALKALLSDGWDIENHGMYHGSVPADQDLDLLYDLIELRVSYPMRVCVVPTNFTGYAHNASLDDYLCTTAQSDVTFDEFLSVRVHETLPPLGSTGSDTYMVMVRDFTDVWDDPSAITWLKSEIDRIMNGARQFERIGTHSEMETTAKLNGFKDLINYVSSSTNDQVMVCTTREALEYREMCVLPMTQTVLGNQVTVEVDLTDLSERNRWRDMSFIINSSSTITGVTSNDFESTSFNASTQLVNVFQQNKTWQTR